MPVRVLIVDDQPSFRELARTELHRRGYTVVGETGCSATAIDAALRLQPDAVLLDIHLGDESGFQVAWEMSRDCPQAAILLVSNDDYGHYAEQLRFCGAPDSWSSHGSRAPSSGPSGRTATRRTDDACLITAHDVDQRGATDSANGKRARQVPKIAGDHPMWAMLAPWY